MRQTLIHITPAMVEAGEDALLSFGSEEDVRATDTSVIVQRVFAAMLCAAGTAPSPAKAEIEQSSALQPGSLPSPTAGDIAAATLNTVLALAEQLTGKKLTIPVETANGTIFISGSSNVRWS